MPSLTHYDIQKVEREYEKLRIHIAADLCRLNAVLPLALMLRRHEIDRIARDLIETIRNTPYRRQGPVLVRLMEGLRFKASSALHRRESQAQTGPHRDEIGENRRGEPNGDELSLIVGDVPSVPFAGFGLSEEADRVRAANSNRPRP